MTDRITGTWMTLGEAAAALGLRVKDVQILVGKGKLSPSRMEVMVPAEAVEAHRATIIRLNTPESAA